MKLDQSDGSTVFFEKLILFGKIGQVAVICVKSKIELNHSRGESFLGIRAARSDFTGRRPLLPSSVLSLSSSWSLNPLLFDGEPLCIDLHRRPS